MPPTFVCGPVYCSTQPLLSPAVTVHQFPLSCFLFLAHLILVALDSERRWSTFPCCRDSNRLWMNQTTSRCVSSLVVNLNFQNYVSCLQDCSRNRDSQIYTLGGELIVHVNVFKRRSSDKCQTGLFVLTVTMNQQSVDCFINSIKSAARSLGLIPRDGYT
jgi:hypothetical protein